MDNRLSKKLQSDFSNLMRYPEDQHMPSFYLFGFETGTGWFPLLYRLCKQLSDIQQSTGSIIQIRQVKEKFGTLRFYCDGPESIESFIDQAEDESGRICEICGRPGQLSGKGWLRTLCSDHLEKKDVELESIIQRMLAEVSNGVE
jgi:hypothetical protein